jgi:hypothetical protein
MSFPDNLVDQGVPKNQSELLLARRRLCVQSNFWHAFLAQP